MAIKWKNTIKRIIKGTIVFLKNYKKEILGGVLAAIGLLIFYALFQNIGALATEEVLTAGSFGNLFLSAGIILLLRFSLRRVYRDWIPKNDTFYAEWKKKWKKQQQTMGQIGIIALIAACWFFFSVKNGYFSRYFYSHYNYAMGYLMIGTVLLQYVVCQACVINFMKQRINLLMEHMTEINRKSMEEALEIERKSMEKVSQSDQLKVDLISNVSHDLKTPLTSMVGYIELMKKEDLNGTMRDYVEVISDKAGKLKEMIESLFSLAKVSSGNIELHMERIELNRLIEQIFGDMEDQIKESGLEYVTVLTKENTGIVTDNMYLYRICQNLLENTVKYSAKGTRVFVKTFIQKETGVIGRERLCLEITNTAGYPMDFKKEDIVERFARGDKARTSEGNGLGLAIVSTYAGALGGDFDIVIDCDQFKARLAFQKEKDTAQ